MIKRLLQKLIFFIKDLVKEEINVKKKVQVLIRIRNANCEPTDASKTIVALYVVDWYFDEVPNAGDHFRVAGACLKVTPDRTHCFFINDPLCKRLQIVMEYVASPDESRELMDRMDHLRSMYQKVNEEPVWL